MTASGSKSDDPHAFTTALWRARLHGFAIPLLTFVFFAVAPTWLDHNVREAIRAEREVPGVALRFELMRWSLGLSALLLGILGATAVATSRLNLRAQRSRADFVAAYRLAWRLNMGTALAKILLLISLLSYGTNEIAMLALGGFYPPLTFAIVLGGLTAIWRSLSILLRRVPMAFDVAACRAIASRQAPELWADVRAVAARLGTPAPDNILVGMDHNFFVTELAVNHSTGQSKGRTLYLSHPLMLHLAHEEVMAIIGHELGHFRGDDTLISREFHPLRRKSLAVVQTMAASGLVGWASVHTLQFFHGSFGATEQEMWRGREFLADLAGAEVSSPAVIASGLIKVHVSTAAFHRSLRHASTVPLATPLASYIRSALSGDESFWNQLFEEKVAHPLDSHPPLRLRLEALGQAVDPSAAMAIALREAETAHARWFQGADLFSAIEAEESTRLDKLRTANADYSTPGGRELLDRQFPEVRCSARRTALGLKFTGCGLGLLPFALLFPVPPPTELKLACAALAAGCLWMMSILWRRHRHGEFVLRADSFSYTGWERPVMFSDLKSVQSISLYNSIIVTFVLQERARGIWKHNPLNWIGSRTIKLDLGLLPGEQQDNLQSITGYVYRQI